MNGDAPYSKTWKEHRADQKVLLFLFVAFFPVLYLVVRPLFDLTKFDSLPTIFAFAWGAAIVLFFYRVQGLVCPRCGSAFMIRYGKFSNPVFWSTRCVHCGLKKYAPDGNGNEPA